MTLLAKGRMAAAQIQQQSYWPSAIQLFNDPQNIKSLSDQHLVELQEFLSFLKQWKAEAGYESCKKVFTSKLWFDLQSMILGFESIVAIKLKKFPQSVIEPPIIEVARLGGMAMQLMLKLGGYPPKKIQLSHLNQDCVENHFCQMRACKGHNNNPTNHLQESAQTPIRYGQTTIRRKNNAGAAGLRKERTEFLCYSVKLNLHYVVILSCGLRVQYRVQGKGPLSGSNQRFTINQHIVFIRNTTLK